VTIHLVGVEDLRTQASLDFVVQHLDTTDHELKSLSFDHLERFDRQSRRVAKKFRHTPEPLIDSWRASQRLTALTQPGDVILMSDRGGLGGIFALEQASTDPELRRWLWTVAADSAFLEMRLIAATHEGFPMPLDSQIDWEVTQYRWSQRVIATSPLAASLVGVLDVAAELLDVSPGESPPSFPVDVSRVWAPGPVSRRGQTGDIFRAMSSVEDVVVIVSDEDSPDEIWTGSSWEALRHSREVLGERVMRLPRPAETPGVIVMGDPFAPPSEDVVEYHLDGVPVVTPYGSVASLMWPSAPAWRTTDELVRILAGGSLELTQSPERTVEPAIRRGVGRRTPRVSVGIPVFRDVRFLRECVESVLEQEQEPIEVLILDDGSQSDEVDQALERVAALDKRVRVFHGEHRGVCVARNSMMEMMTGDSFVFVDSDDTLVPSFIGRCANVMTSSNVWAVATWTEFFGAYEAIEAKPPFDRRVGLRENTIISTSALVDMRVRDEGIRFSPDLAFLYGEDWHFWSQIVAAGGEMGLVPAALARHRVHPSSGGYLRTDLAQAVGRSRATGPLRGANSSDEVSPRD
jgi:hypothetical protein